MDDLYSFGKKKYIPADPLQCSFQRSTKNVFIVLFLGIKCFVFGLLIVIKSLVFLFIPRFAKDIQHQVALITGGANGIGRAIAVELAKCGCKVAICDVDLEGAIETVEELHLLGVKAFAYKVDVANYDEIIVLKEKIKADLGEVDILVNNAGLLPRISLLHGSTEDILRIFKVNLISYFWTIRVFLPSMISRNRGHVVGISSVMGVESTGRAIGYASSKFGIRGLMDGLYDLVQMDNLNINVTTVFPKLVNTRKEFVDHFIAHGGMTPATELTFYTPQEIADATVDGILKNKQYVSVPWVLKSVITLLQLLPDQFQNLIRDNFKPKVGPEANEPVNPPASHLNSTK